MSAPHFKLESPAESLVDSFGTPGQQYNSLFETMDAEVLTPQSFDDDSMFGDSVAGETPAAESQKKPVKKRKSWGQQLPEPKTNLPPRKRAKTEDEKEQRRVERVLRNRRAAQSSRERKRQEVEALEAEKRQIERRNQDLEQQLADMQAKFIVMQQQLEAATGGNMTVFRGSAAASPAHTDQFRSAPSPVTLSQELFSSRDTPERASISSQISIDTQTTVQTVNPASLSPEIHPVVESSNASSSDMTQHPAAMLCDLQCQSEQHRPWTASTTAAIFQILATTLAASWALLNPLSQILHSLRTGSSLSPTTSILTTIIWLTTTTSALMNSSSTSSSTTTRTTNPRPRYSLRIRLLNRLLSCSPELARPLLDATKGEMRLASEQQRSNSCLTGAGSSDRPDVSNSPSLESLTALLWATQCFLKKEQWQEPKLDVTTVDVRQLSWELGSLFRQREIRRPKGISYMTVTSGGHKKSLDRWRAALG